MGRLGSRIPAVGIKTLSDLQIDVDKDWKAHDIDNLGNITPKVDGVYKLGTPNVRFDTAYANNIVPAAETLIHRTIPEAADNIYGADTDSIPAGFFDAWPTGLAADIAYNSNLQLVKEASIFDHPNLSSPKAADIAYDPTMVVAHDASLLDHTNLTVPKGADITYQPELLPVKFADIVEHGNLSFSKAKDFVYHGNFNLGSTEARDKVAKTAYGVAKDMVGVKGFVHQINQEKTFAFRTETPNHAYWHRLYNTPAAFETVYQNYTTSMQKKGTTPQKSAPNTADPNPQPGAMWSVLMIPDGTQVGGFTSPGPNPRSAAWDGEYFWTSDFDASYIYQLKTDGTQVAGFPSPAPSPQDMTWDGEYIWNSDLSANYVYQLKTDGTQVAGFPSPSANPHGIAWDGTYIWNATDGNDYIYKLNTDGTVVDSFPAPAAGAPGTQGLTWDGKYLWYSNINVNYIYQLKTDGTQVGGFTAPAAGTQGLGWDGVYLWNPDSLGYVYQLGNAGNFDVNYRIFAK